MLQPDYPRLRGARLRSGRWARADPAVLFAALPLRGLLSCLLAIVPTRREVTSFVAIDSLLVVSGYVVPLGLWSHRGHGAILPHPFRRQGSPGNFCARQIKHELEATINSKIPENVRSVHFFHFCLVCSQDCARIGSWKGKPKRYFRSVSTLGMSYMRAAGHSRT